MSKIEIDLNDYLSEDEKRRIAEEEFRAAIRRSTETANDVERFIGNVAWVAVWGEAEKALTETRKFGPDLQKTLREKIAEVVDKVTFQSLIWDADRYLHRDKSTTLKVIEEVVQGNRGKIEDAVRRLLDTPNSDQALLWAMQDAIQDAVAGMFENARDRIGGGS